jgi:DNA-binding GntR family transcriptional regulator
MYVAEPARETVPLARRAYASLRADILYARLRPGELLSENQLAQQLAISRTPVREAIQRLAREGLVHVLPQRGSRVALLSLQRIREALFVREAVESHVIRRLLSIPVDAGNVALLKSCIGRQADAVACDNLESMMRCDEDFHRALLALCGMEGVWPIVAQARDMHQRVRAIAVPELQTGKQAVRDHRAIVRALESRDVDRTVAQMAQHLRQNEALTSRVANLHPDYFEAAGNAQTTATPLVAGFRRTTRY